MATSQYKLLLFVSGMAVKSVTAIENIKAICAENKHITFDLQIIDIRKGKTMAKEYQVFAIPTLIRIKPGPRRIMIGDLSDTKKVLKSLEI